MKINPIANRTSRRHRDRSAFFPMLAAALSLLAASALAETKHGPPVATEDSPARKLLDRMFRERNELLSGEYKARGRCERVANESRFEGDIVVDCAFDSVRGMVRWEREEPRLFLDPDAPDDPATVRQTGYRVIKTPEKCYLQNLFDGLNTTQFLSITEPDSEPDGLGRPYDVRAFGLMDWSSVESTVTLQRVTEWFSGLSNIELNEMDRGTVEIRCTIFANMRQKWRIDTARGDVVTYSQVDAFDTTKNMWTDAISKAEIAWEERNAVWVPTALLLQRHFNGLETYEIQLEWESVNKPLSADEFEPEALHLLAGSLIADSRLGGKPIVVGRVGSAEELMPISVHRASETTRWYWGIAIGTLAILLIGAAWFWRRRASSV